MEYNKMQINYLKILHAIFWIFWIQSLAVEVYL